MNRKEQRRLLRGQRTFNNRKRTLGRKRQYVELKNGKTKVVTHK